MPFKPFHVIVHGKPEDVTLGEPIELQGQTITPLEFGAAPLPLSATFDAALAELEALPRMFIEPDGSFLWRSEAAGAWQLEGELYDQGRQLAHVELRGFCDEPSFPTLLNILGDAERPVMFQLVRQALYLDKASFFQSIWR